VNLQDRLTREIKEATLAKDTARLGALRMLKSAVGYAAIDRKTDTLPDAEFINVVQRELKKRRDSMEQFEKAGRTDLARREAAEITILETFLPQPFAPEELESLAQAVIAETGAQTKKDMGGVIKAVQARAAGRADGRSISAIVGKLLP
jgi:uncharacterized protein YqeY